MMEEHQAQEPASREPGDAQRATAGGPQPGGEMTEEEFRARLEEEMKRVTVEDVLLNMAATVANLGFQRLGLTDATRDARDLTQVRQSIEAIRALLPLFGEERAREASALKDGLSRLQIAYAREVGSSAPPGSGRGPSDDTGQAAGDSPPAEPGPSVHRPSASGLWTPPGAQS